jgi:hypothetical protein
VSLQLDAGKGAGNMGVSRSEDSIAVVEMGVYSEVEA